MARPYRPLLGPFVQVLPPGQQPAKAEPKPKTAKAQPKPKTAPVATRPAKRTPFGASSMMLGTCKKGHALTARNSYLNNQGQRVCSLCNLV